MAEDSDIAGGRLFEPPVCTHETSTLGRHINSDGSSRVWRRCDACGENTGGPGKWLAHTELAGNLLESLPVFDSYKAERPPCVRCGSGGTQLHHFFPRHVLGGVEADLWPTAWLCPGCHTRWHELVERAAS